MQALTFQQILNDCVRATGWRLEQPEVSEKLPVFAELINDCTRRAMEYEYWPDTMRIERRTATLVDDVIVVSGTGSSLDGRFILQPDLYQDYAYWLEEDGTRRLEFNTEWRFTESAGGAALYSNPSTDSAPPFEDWVQGIGGPDLPVLAFYRFVNVDKGDRWDLDGIGRVERYACLFDGLPVGAQYRGAMRQVEELNGRIYCNDVRFPEQPFVRFQIPVPQFSDAAYDATASYAQGDVVFEASSGNCYMSRTNSNTGNALSDVDYWKLQVFPAFLRSAVKWYVASEFLSEEGGRYQTQAKGRRELERLQLLVPQRAYRDPVY